MLTNHRSNSPGIGPQFWTALETHAEQPPQLATRVETLRDNAKAFDARLDLIANAKKTLACTLYHMEANETSYAFLDALIAASKRGVFVALSLDFLAETGTLLAAKGSEGKKLEGKLRELAESGSFVSWFATPTEQLKYFGQGNHYKALVADGERAIIGGRNMGDSYFKTWTDFDALLEGPIVTSVVEAALKVLRRSNPNNRFSNMGSHAVQSAAYNTTLDLIRESAAKAAPKMLAAAQARVDAGETLPRFQLVFHDPTQAPGQSNPVTDALVDTFRSANTEVLATSNYVNPVAPLRTAAVEASLRGVQTLFTSTSEEASETSSLPALNAAVCLQTLFNAGARVLETNRQEHGKMYVADRQVAAFGSYNLEHPAHDRLIEGLLFTDDKKTVDAVHDAIMDTADNRSRPFAPDTKQRGFFQKIGFGARKLMARLILPFA